MDFDAVEVAGDLSVALARDFGVFLADPNFHLRHLFHGLGELLFHLDAVELASDLTVLYDLGEAPFHLDAVELTRDSDLFLYARIQSHLDAIQ